MKPKGRRRSGTPEVSLCKSWRILLCLRPVEFGRLGEKSCFPRALFQQEPHRLSMDKFSAVCLTLWFFDELTFYRRCFKITLEHLQGDSLEYQNKSGPWLPRAQFRSEYIWKWNCDRCKFLLVHQRETLSRKDVCTGTWRVNGTWLVVKHLVAMNLSILQEIVEAREAWLAAVHRVAKSQTWPSDWTATINTWKNVLVNGGLVWKVSEVGEFSAFEKLKWGWYGRT